MEKKVVLVDMDGVLADVHYQFIKFEKEETGRDLSKKKLVGLEEFKAFPNGRKHIFMPSFFRDAPVISGSQEILRQVNDAYDVYIVSAATEFPQSLSEKQAWLSEHFPFIIWQQIIFCGRKTQVKGDYMIDDLFENLDNFNGQGLLFTQHHNQNLETKENIRVNNWQEVKDILLP